MSKHSLRRYTELPYLLQMLEQREIKLLSASKWEDRNDAFFLEQYRQRRRLGAVLAWCLTDRKTTFHHWKIFAPGSSGVSIKFHKSPLLRWAEANRLDPRAVRYLSMSKMQKHRPRLEEWPYLKRRAFKDEREVRFIHASKTDISFKSFRFDLDLIEEITLNPWIHLGAMPAVEKAIRALLPGKVSLRIQRHDLLDNEEWKQHAR